MKSVRRLSRYMCMLRRRKNSPGYVYSFTVYPTVHYVGAVMTTRLLEPITTSRRVEGDAENAGLEYAGLENTAPTWNEKSREHR